MTTDKDKKAFRQQITATAASLAVFTLGMTVVGLFASEHVKVLAVLIAGAIVSLGYGGALFIKATSTRGIDSREKSRWTLLDSRLMN